MAKSPEIRKALQTSGILVRQYVAGLEKENAKLQTQIAKLEVESLSQKNRIAALEKIRKEPQEIKISWLAEKPNQSPQPTPLKRRG